MAFKFSLDTALNVRSRQEKLQMRAMAERIGVQRAVELEIEAIKQQLANGDENINEFKRSSHLNVSQMKFLYGFKNKMKVDLDRLAQDLHEAKKEVEVERLKLVEASKKKKTLEILKEKELKRYQENIARLDRNFQDEVAGNQFSHKLRTKEGAR